jgi:lipopolysaccharide/colanic/teichoic acid biosynthesis glycosyltransferase
VIKRIIDISISSSALLIFLPLLLLIAIINMLFLKGKIFFIQDRSGYKGKVFKIIKFKTMNDNTDRKGGLLTDGERLTAFGRFLRSSSLDELPTLWNIILGHMSLVGPRPLLVKYLDRYDENQLRRLEAKPGLTGLAQVNGRNSISWEKKFEYDVWYVDNRSLKLDLIIIFKTIGQVIRGKGISQKSHSTMEEFMGTNK